MTAQVAVDEVPRGRSQCWCCGTIEDPVKLVHLGKHPEVTVCARCAHWMSKRAWEIEDVARTGFAVRLRDRLRLLRKSVMHHGWHRKPIVGRPLRWLGKHLP